MLKEHSVGFMGVGGEMTKSPVNYRSITIYQLLVGFFLALNMAMGVAIGHVYLPLPFDIWFTLLPFLVVPVLMVIVAFAIGYTAKKRSVEYTAPEWDYNPVQYTVDDVRQLIKDYHRDYLLLESRSNYWFFHIPIIIIVAIYALPFYVSLQNPSFLPVAQWILPVAFALNHIVASFGAFLATSNDASKDFTLPLIREALWLVEEQSKAKGVSQARVVMNQAELGDLRVYTEPRVILRIRGFEKSGYIETWSDDLKAIARLFCRLHETDTHGQVIWWWQSWDRNFRKYSSPDDEGYYVRQPIPSQAKELGVRDALAVTENAIAILMLEIIRLEGDSELASSILS
ncbi:MAG: hypothetical protein JSW05_08530 [Candidatus Thorarchaeota archaeon]|nr:MAG: hypothetical protein JSW05_08530 [Candidatus Thorarchaeota archaeon]